MMVKSKSMDTLNITNCVDGLNLTIKNAERLYKEGLKLGKKSPTAVFLYAIAIEELGKAHLLGTLIEVLLDNKTINWRSFWKFFRSHKFKQTGILSMMRLGQELLSRNFEEIKKKRPDLLKFTPNVKSIEKQIKSIDKTIKEVESGLLEEIKWKHIYVDYQNNRWLTPKIKKAPTFFRKENLETYLIDINTMRKQLLQRIKVSQQKLKGGSFKEET